MEIYPSSSFESGMSHLALFCPIDRKFLVLGWLGQNNKRRIQLFQREGHLLKSSYHQISQARRQLILQFLPHVIGHKILNAKASIRGGIFKIRVSDRMMRSGVRFALWFENSLAQRNKFFIHHRDFSVG